MPTRYSEAEAPRYLSRKDTADLLGVSVRSVDRYAADGLIDARRLGPKLVRITMASIEEFLTKQAS